ncbi:MAG: M28 family peptidase [Balneolales bacterium]
MRIVYFSKLIACILLLSCSTQNQVATYGTDLTDLYPFQDLITAESLRNHLEVIAHDSLQGRGTGEAGIDRASEYLAGYHEAMELIPIGDDESYFQHFNLNSYTLHNITFRTSTISGEDTTLVDESIFEQGEAAPFTPLIGGDRPLSGDLIFAGFGAIDTGRDIDHFGREDIDGNWVIVFEDIPYVVDGDTLINPGFDNLARYNEVLGTRKAAGLIVIPAIDEAWYLQHSAFNSMELGSPISLILEYMPEQQHSGGAYLSMNPVFAAEILGLSDGLSGLDRLREALVEDITGFQARNTGSYLESIPDVKEESIEAKNVVSYFEGGDPELKDEVVVLMAHYDHLGTGTADETGDTVYNGADDNGSGTVTMLSIARSLKEAADAGVRPKRSVVFLHVSGEEWGLLGSRYYSDHPIVPIEQTAANINMDMIGRRDRYHIEREEEDFIYIIGAEIISSDLDSLLREGNRKSTDLALNMRYNDLDDPNQFYRRSDHWNFGRLEVPFIFFFSGIHEDYHAQGDTVDKILFDALESRARLIYATTLEIANAAERPEVDSEEFLRRTRP